MALEVTMTTEQFTTAHVVGKDVHGHVEAFAVPPTWTVSDALISIEPAADGASCRITATVPTGTLGTSTVTAHYAPAGGPELTAELIVTLVAPGIAVLEMTVDPPQNLP